MRQDSNTLVRWTKNHLNQIAILPTKRNGIQKIASKLCYFTQDRFKFKILWSTRQVKTLFNLKDKVQYTANVVYLGTCLSCKADYVGETCRNFKTRQSEHENPNHNSEPAQHIAKNKEHSFEWKILNTAKQWKSRKIKESIYIANLKPSLNKQLKSFELRLFPRGVT